MNSDQQLIAFVGIFLIGLTVWQHWRKEVTAILFNVDPPAQWFDTPTDQFGNPTPGGSYRVQPPTPGVGNPKLPTIVPTF